MPPFLTNMFSDSDDGTSGSSSESSSSSSSNGELDVGVEVDVDVSIAVESSYYREGEDGEMEYHTSRQELGIDGNVSSDTLISNGTEALTMDETDYGGA